jgi:hypothetical protein
MSATLAMALSLQAAAIMLLRHRLGRSWLLRPPVLLLLASVIYQGVSPLLMTAASVRYWDVYRQGLQQRYTDEATLVVAVAMVAFTLAYLLTRPERAVPGSDPEAILNAARALDWRLLGCACLPLAVLTYQGRGYNSGGPATGAGASLSASLAADFFIVLMVLTAFSFILCHGAQLFLPVLITQSLLLAAAGERTPVVIDAVALAVLLAHAGYRVRRSQVRAAAALTIVAVLAITGARAAHGREVYHQDSLSARVIALGSGLSGLGSDSAGPGLVAQAATRFDGTSFAGAIRQSESLGRPGLAASNLPGSLLLAVPSALWPSKLAHKDALNPYQAETDDFGLQNTNFLPGLPGLYMGFLSPPWLAAFLALLGLLAGWGERWLLRRCTPARLVLLAGGVSAVLLFEAGLPAMLVALRSAAVLALAVKVIAVARGRRARRRPAPLPARRSHTRDPQPLARNSTARW